MGFCGRFSSSLVRTRSRSRSLPCHEVPHILTVGVGARLEARRIGAVRTMEPCWGNEPRQCLGHAPTPSLPPRRESLEYPFLEFRGDVVLPPPAARVRGTVRVPAPAPVPPRVPIMPQTTVRWRPHLRTITTGRSPNYHNSELASSALNRQHAVSHAG